MTVGNRMKRRRKELGMNAETVAQLLNVSPSTIYRYENGDIEKMGIDKLWPIAKAIQTTPEYLMGWEDKKPAPISESELDLKLIDLLVQLQPDELAKVDAFAQGLIAARKA